MYQNKPSVLLATSPGGGGASNVLAAAKASAPHFNMDLKAELSVPSFYANFDVEKGKLKNNNIQEQLETALSALL